MTFSADFFRDVDLVRECLARQSSTAEHRLSSTKVAAAVESSEIDYRRLQAFSARGNLVEIQVKSGSEYEARFVADSTSVFVFEGQTGSFEAVALDEAAGTSAIGSCQFVDLAAAIANPTLRMSLTLRAPTGDASFVWAETALFEMVESWPALAQLLARCRGLLILDAGDSTVATESLTIYGPGTSSVLPAKTPQIWKFGEIRLASPAHYVPTSANGLPLVSEALRRLACGVTWLRIATSGSVIADGGRLGTVRINVAENPPSNLDVAWLTIPSAESEAAKANELWGWLEGEDQPGRLEAARQAASTSIRTASELTGAATVVLRQARFIHDLSRRHAVAAIVDARKAAWASSQGAANTAASEARSSARSAADRTVAAVIASLAVMITYQSEVLSRSVSYLVLVAVLVGIAAAALQAEKFEFPATESALDATLAELRTTQRHILLSEDVDEIVAGAVVTDARSTLSKARRASRFALGMAALSVVLGTVVVSLIQPNKAANQPTPSTSTVPSASTTTASPTSSSVVSTTPSPRSSTSTATSTAVATSP